MKRSLLARGVPVVVLALLSACRGQVRPEEVPGTYALNKGAAADTLVLGSRGSYTHLFVPLGQAAVRDTGSWKAEATPTGLRLTMSGFSMHPRVPIDSQPPVVRGFWVVDIGRTLGGRLRLPVDEDIGVYYVRR